MTEKAGKTYFAYYLHGRLWGAREMFLHGTFTGEQLRSRGWVPMLYNWAFADAGTAKLVALSDGSGVRINPFSESVWVPKAYLCLCGWLTEYGLTHRGSPGTPETMADFATPLRTRGRQGALEAFAHLGLVSGDLEDDRMVSKFGDGGASRHSYELRYLGRTGK